MSCFYIIPQLIKQPTWGGTYIAQFKECPDSQVCSEKIGQSYELTGESQITRTKPLKPTVLLTDNTLKNQELIGSQVELHSLNELIQKDPEAVLGKKVVTRFGKKMPLLIKFTQAQNNSYQLHVPPTKEFGGWVAKPESWYYFEPGRATLGLNPATSLEEYKERCIAINNFAKQLSKQVKQNQLDIQTARQQLAEFINQDHPVRFVNSVLLEKDSIIDLSVGGLHHSWETDPNLPLGNIVYEVQQDVKDDISTLRSFDQGSIKDDGSVRELQIEEYFKAINTDPTLNTPTTVMQHATPFQEGGATTTKLFANDFYHLTHLAISGEYSGKHTKTKDKFHHLFVQEGIIDIITKTAKYQLTKGWSLFISAEVEEYTIKPLKKTAVVLKTTI